MNRDEGIYSATYADGTRIRLGDKVLYRGERWEVRTIHFHQTAPDGPGVVATVDLFGVGPQGVGWPDARADDLTHDPDPLAVMLDVLDAKILTTWLDEWFSDPESDASPYVWDVEANEPQRETMRRLAVAIRKAQGQADD